VSRQRKCMRKKRENDPKVCLENLEPEVGFRAQCSPTRWLGRAFSSDADPGRSRGLYPSMSGGSAKSIFHPPIETPSYAVSPTRESCVGGFGTGSPPSAVKTTALSVKDDRVSAWPRAMVPQLPALEKTAMAADRTNIKSATWIRSFVICVSLKRVGTRKAWIVTLPRGPWLA
jgi:hypothetical protein